MRPTTSSRDGGRPATAALPLVSLVLYCLSFPGPLAPQGLGFLSLIALVPLFAWLPSTTLAGAAIAGAVYGAALYAYIVHWLAAYNPLALAFAVALEAIWFAAAFAGAKAASRLPSLAGPLGTAAVWAAVEIIKSLGFLGFPYGTLPYALWRSEAALSLASFGGTAAVSLAIALCNAGLAYAAVGLSARDGRSGRPKAWLSAVPGLLCLAAVAVLGKPGQSGGSPAVSIGSGSGPAEGRYRVALVQACWMKPQNGAADYAASFGRLAELSLEAAGHSPALVVWHETAIRPPLAWNLRHRPNRDDYGFAAGVESFLKGFPVPVLFGDGYVDPDDPRRLAEYNAALLYEGGREAGRYAKMRLVPFTEYFPAEDSMPALASWLVARFGYFWTQGRERTVFSSGGARFAAPICFEDSFGRHVAGFDEPDFFVVLTDDSWARSPHAQTQHLAMSAFRAAETGGVVLRAADSGATAAIGPDGAVVGVLPYFEPGVLLADVEPGRARRTAYEKGGKDADAVIVGLGLAALAAAAARGLASSRRRRRGLD